MKKVVFLFCFFLFALTPLFSHDFPEPYAGATHKQLKVYLCSRLSKEAQLFNNHLCGYFDNRFSLFRPQDVDISSIPSEMIDFIVYREDIAALKKAHLLFMVLPSGRDCAWESGWAVGANRLVIAYAEEEGNWLHDAMVKGGLHYLITPSKALFEKLEQYPELNEKARLISSEVELSDLIWKLYSEFRRSREPHYVIKEGNIEEAGALFSIR